MTVSHLIKMTWFVAYHSKLHTSPLSHKCSHHMQSSLTFALHPPPLPTMCSLSPSVLHNMWCRRHCESIHFPNSHHFIMSNIYADVSQFPSCQLLYCLLICLLMIGVKVCECFAEAKLAMLDWYFNCCFGWTTFVHGPLVSSEVMSLWFILGAFSSGHAACSVLHLETYQFKKKGQMSLWGILGKSKITFIKKDSILIT